MNKKSNLFFIIIVVTILLWSAISMIYKKVTFDLSYKANIKENNVTKIYNGDGYWTWNNKEYDFYNDYSFSLNNNEIVEFCKITNSSKITDDVVIKPKEWLFIYIEKTKAERIIVVLKKNNEGDVYFEFEDNMFKGKELEEHIYKHIKKTIKNRLKSYDSHS